MQIHKTLSISDLYIPIIYRFNIRLFLGMNKYWFIKEFLPTELQPYSLITDISILQVISMNGANFFKDKKNILLTVKRRSKDEQSSPFLWYLGRFVTHYNY